MSESSPMPPAPDRPLPSNPDGYWVVPGRLLAGEYPGAADPAMARRKVAGLVRLGVTLFVDLTCAGELEPYGELVAAAGAEQGRSVRCRRMPIEDVSVPTPLHMRSILDLLDAEQAAGGLAYVHCWGGIGRTGTVVGCHLVRQGMPGAEALGELIRLRRTCRKRHRRSPETPGQEDFVRSWPLGG